VREQDFTFRDVNGRNVIASKAQSATPAAGEGNVLIILGAHYDTRSLADRDAEDKSRPVPGANDGASGVAVLLELARTLDMSKARAGVELAFFDAEDQGNINGWPFSVGAAYMAQHLDVQPQAVVVVDMIGDADQQIFWEGNSNLPLMEELWGIAKDLGYAEQFVPQYRYTLTDDHAPFLQQGIPAVDIIDFDYPSWHTAADTPDKVSAASLERVGHVLKTWIESRP